MPKEVRCNHPNCGGDLCKQLTSTELCPGPGDALLGAELVRDGWLSVSTKHRRVARLTSEWPKAENLIRSEMLDTLAGKEMVELYRRRSRHVLRRFSSGNQDEAKFVEIMELTIKQFRAFKQLGGECA